MRIGMMSLVVALAPQALALTYGQAVSLARSLPPGSYSSTDHGKLCEIIGLAALQEDFPDARIYNGIAYSDATRTIGELDLVVEENGVATHVIEVKCMKDFRSAARKADDQLARFSRYAGRCDIDFSLVGGEVVDCDLFANPQIIYGKMSYRDALSSGFDYELDLTRSQILTLIDSMKN